MNITVEELLDIISDVVYIYETAEKNFRKNLTLETGIDPVNKYYGKLVRDHVKEPKDNQ